MERDEIWPPPPSIPPPGAENVKPQMPPARGYRIGFVGLMALILTGVCVSLTLPTGLAGLIVGMIGLSFSICGFLQSIRDIRSSAANADRDGLVIGGLGIFLNVTTFLITCFITLALAFSL